MKKCPFCGADVEDSARFCLYCMQTLTEKEQILLHQKKKPLWLVLIAAVVALSVALVLVLLSKQSAIEIETPSDTLQLEDTSPSIPTEPAEPLHIHDFSVENTAIEYQKDGATCTAPAIFYYSCVCGEKSKETFPYGEPTSHTIVTDKGYPATCKTQGLTDGTHCSVCNTVLSSQAQIPVVGHTYDNDKDERCNECNYIRILNCSHAKTDKLAAVPPTCTAAGLTEGIKCSLCEEILSAQTVLPPSGHKEVTDHALVATCTTAGKTEGKHCAICNVVLVAQIILDAKGHTEVIDPAVAATCTTGGKTEGKYCTTCHTILVAQTTVKAKGHTEVIDPAVAATCTTAGKTEGKHCAICQIVLVYQQHIPALGHSFDPENILAPCSVCGAPSPHNHSYTEENTADEYLKVPANCLAPAVYYYSCICGEKGSETFSSGNKGDCVIVTDQGYPATCDTTGLTDSTYCSVCHVIYTPHTEIRELGHTFVPGSTLPTCLVCGSKGTVIVQEPDALFFQNNTFQIDSIFYVIRRDIYEEKWEISVSIKGTNLTSSPACMSPYCSLYFYDSLGHWTGSSGSNYTCTVEPNESGTCMAYFRVSNSASVYKLVIS